VHPTNTTSYDGTISEVHSSVSKQLYGNRGAFGGGNQKKGGKLDLQAFMREKLAKTKISSEATSSG
jgi:hypothetical protein